MKEELNNEIDKKNCNFFMVDNDLIKIYGHFIGSIPVSIYVCLKQHYNIETGVSFPSHKLIAYELKLSTRTVIRHIKTLIKYNIISEVRKSNTYMGRWPHNVYFLSNIKDWILPPDFMSHGKYPSPYDLKGASQVTDCHTKKTKINKTSIDIDSNLLLEEIRRMGKLKQYRVNDA